jgi:CDP-diacylglycerol pyrophosphatase
MAKMLRMTSRVRPVVVTALTLAGIVALLPGSVHALSSRLWQLVHDQCIVHARAHEPPTPCVELVMNGEGAQAAEDTGHAILKDRRGVLQFLLIATRRSPGVEDPRLLSDDAPPYWEQAWAAHRFMSELHGEAVPREAVSLAINSTWSRSEDQLHIHISCVRADIRARLLSEDARLGASWSLLDGGWMGHTLWVRRIVAENLSGVDPFREVADHVPGARDSMGHFGIAVVGARFSDGRFGFFLVASPVDLAVAALGSAERDVQDHDCGVLH